MPPRLMPANRRTDADTEALRGLLSRCSLVHRFNHTHPQIRRIRLGHGASQNPNRPPRLRHPTLLGNPNSIPTETALRRVGRLGMPIRTGCSPRHLGRESSTQSKASFCTRRTPARTSSAAERRATLRPWPGPHNRGSCLARLSSVCLTRQFRVVGTRPIMTVETG